MRMERLVTIRMAPRKTANKGKRRRNQWWATGGRQVSVQKLILCPLLMSVFFNHERSFSGDLSRVTILLLSVVLLFPFVISCKVCFFIGVSSFTTWLLIPFFTSQSLFICVKHFWASSSILTCFATSSILNLNWVLITLPRLEELEWNWGRGWKRKYIPYKLPSKVVDSKDNWLYIENHEPSLPDPVLGPPRIRNE